MAQAASRDGHTATSGIRAVEFTRQQRRRRSGLARVGRPVPRRRGDRHRDRRRRLRHPPLPHRHHRPSRHRDVGHSLEPVAFMPSTRSARTADCGKSTARPPFAVVTRTYGAPLARPRPPNRRNPAPHRNDEPLLRTRHRRDRAHSLNLTGKGDVTPQASATQQRPTRPSVAASPPALPRKARADRDGHARPCSRHRRRDRRRCHWPQP